MGRLMAAEFVSVATRNVDSGERFGRARIEKIKSNMQYAVRKDDGLVR